MHVTPCSFIVTPDSFIVTPDLIRGPFSLFGMKIKSKWIPAFAGKTVAGIDYCRKDGGWY